MEIRATDMDEKSEMRREAIEKVIYFFVAFFGVFVFFYIF